MNYLWGSMILIGIIYGTVTGHLEEVSEAAIQSSKEAVSLCVVMAGVTALWVGMMRIAEKSGLLESAGERPGTRLGGDTGRAESDGRTVGSGRRAAEKKTAGGSCGCSK